MSGVETVILCEGYHDRAFWSGWLLHLGCTDPGLPKPGRTGRQEVVDAGGRTVKGGDFMFLTSAIITYASCPAEGVRTC